MFSVRPLWPSQKSCSSSKIKLHTNRLYLISRLLLNIADCTMFYLEESESILSQRTEIKYIGVCVFNVVKCETVQEIWIFLQGNVPLRVLVLVLAKSRLTQSTKSAAEGYYHLMILCFFLFQEPLALHAPRIYKDKAACDCIRVCECEEKLTCSTEIREWSRNLTSVITFLAF